MEKRDPDVSSPKPRRGTRITPRTCLWPLAGSLCVTFGLSVGLTFRSENHCYAGTCGEWLFPLQARLHVVIWYAWLAASTTFLAVRAFHPELQRFLSRPVAKVKLPLFGKHATVGGSSMVLWVVCLYGVVVGVWWIRLRDYFHDRNAAAGIRKGGNQLAAVALTGHLCDITMGIVLLPISRHSALASFFKISVSTTLTNHIVAAYTLFILVITHGLIFVSWIPIFNSLTESLRKVTPVLNPTYHYDETWPGDTSCLGIWRASLIFTGSASAMIMVILFITTLPKVRATNFNLFYFTHLSTILMVVIVCLHASTMFYCTAPGLAMWLLDWGMRFYELRETLDGSLASLRKGWYCITLPLPRARLAGCSCRSPLAHFYIHHASSSTRELHPFTTITHLASANNATDPLDDTITIQFLFRKQGVRPTDQDSSQTPPRLPLHRRLLRGKNSRIKSAQWTAKLASLADTQGYASATIHEWNPSSDVEFGAQKQPLSGIPVSLRLEGPYFSPADPHRYDTVICLVAGTGISGAIAIASAFNHLNPRSGLEPSTSSVSKRRWRRCIIFWTLKANDDIVLPFLEPMAPGLVVRKFLTGEGRKRVDLGEELKRWVGVGERTWCYVSGPSAYLEAGKEACKRAGKGVEVYAAKWDI